MMATDYFALALKLALDVWKPRQTLSPGDSNITASPAVPDRPVVIFSVVQIARKVKEG